ncbi:MAG: DNA-binding protein [Desulfarculus sp.]|nr:MAG: DNA-binding protein [Desulfarculus sp.]
MSVVGESVFNFPTVLTPEEAASLLRVHPETVRRLMREGRLPAAKVGGSWRTTAEALSAHLADQIRVAHAGGGARGEGLRPDLPLQGAGQGVVRGRKKAARRPNIAQRHIRIVVPG